MKQNENQNRPKRSNPTKKNGSAEGKAKLKSLRRMMEKEWMQKALVTALADGWWDECSPSIKVLAMTLMEMTDEMTESKRIEIRLEAGAVRARFIHVLSKPEPGCLSAIMLPEMPTEPWN